MQIYPSPLPAIETMGRENSMHMNFRGPARRSEQLARSLDGSCWRRVLPFEFGRACAGPPLLVPPTASSRDPVGPGAQAREQEGPSLPTAPPRRDPRGRIWRPSSTTALSHQGPENKGFDQTGPWHAHVPRHVSSAKRNASRAGGTAI
ncbi:unnamed protein product [Prorocentrum cordatum]|uniref:Uncharacterized protein n=1 Tax=Prorocentrum cordatum TaxID=2364126 RepID=A0ABN9WRG8_9DINO|nr:unnamed protein product [Polarella glacialis]